MAEGLLLLAADRADSHQPDADRKERGEAKDTVAQSRRWCGEADEDGRSEGGDQEEGDDAILPDRERVGRERCSMEYEWQGY